MDHSSPQVNLNLLSDSSKMSIGRSRTVRTPQVPTLTPSLFIDATRAAESFVSKDMNVLQLSQRTHRHHNIEGV